MLLERVLLEQVEYKPVSTEGTIPVLRERLNNRERGLHNTGAARCRNHAGIRSKPVAVGRSLSRSLKISQSVT